MKRVYFQKNTTDEEGKLPLGIVNQFKDETAVELNITWKMLYDADIYDIIVRNTDGPFISNHNVGYIAINTNSSSECFFIFNIKEEFKCISSIYNKVMQLVYNMVLPTSIETLFTIIPKSCGDLYMTALKNNNYTIKTDEANDVITGTTQVDLKISEI